MTTPVVKESLTPATPFIAHCWQLDDTTYVHEFDGRWTASHVVDGVERVRGRGVTMGRAVACMRAKVEELNSGEGR